MYDNPYIKITDDQAETVVVQTLSGYLGLCLDYLYDLRQKTEWTDVQRQDFVDNLRSAQATIFVLQDFTVEQDFTQAQQTLNEYSDYLTTDF